MGVDLNNPKDEDLVWNLLQFLALNIQSIKQPQCSFEQKRLVNGKSEKVI